MGISSNNSENSTHIHTKTTTDKNIMAPISIQQTETPKINISAPIRRGSIKQSLASSIYSHKSSNLAPTSLPKSESAAALHQPPSSPAVQQHHQQQHQQHQQPPQATSKMSKFKIFSKFSFSKQTPQNQNTTTPKTSILSKSIKAEEQKQKVKEVKTKSVDSTIPLTPSGSETSTNSQGNLSQGREITLSIKEEDEIDDESEDKEFDVNDVTTANAAITNNVSCIGSIKLDSKIPNPMSQQEMIETTSDNSSNPINILPGYQTPNSNLANSLNDHHRSLLLDSDSDSDAEADPKKLKSEEKLDDYRPGGYHPVFTGETYGRDNEYLIVRKLGWGHFSTVWLAWDSKHSRHVAIKIVRSSQNYSEAALDEIKILEKVGSSNDSHEGKKHIVQLLDHFIHAGPNGNHVCMVFQVLGENMLNLLLRYKEFQSNRQKEIGDLLEEDDKDESNWDIHLNNLTDLHILSESYGGLPLTLVKQISKQILLALDYLHRECGIIHTDIKPENVLVEIHDVEKLVQLLEDERKNKKLEKIMRKREHQHSQSMSFHHKSSFSMAQNNRLNSISTSSSQSNSMTPLTPHAYNSLSRSISTHHSIIPNTPNHMYNNSISNPNNQANHTMNHSSSNNNLNGNLSRKNSIPVRSSKPLTSPVETSSVNNFFRSFSFTQKRTPSFSANLSSAGGSHLSASVNANSPMMSINRSFSLEKPDIGLSSSYIQGIAIIDEDDVEDDKLKNTQLENVIERPDLSNFKSSSTLMAVPLPIMKSKSSLLSSSSESENDVFVDADSLLPLIDENEGKDVTISTEKSLPAKAISITSLESLQTIPTLSNHDESRPIISDEANNSENAIPFPAPITQEAVKPALKLDTSVGIEEPDRNMSTVSQTSVLAEFDEIISIKIADLGNSCWYNKHYTPDIQTRQYRAPEVILGGDWGCSTDLWSTACLIFELITSDYLFDAKCAATYTKNDDHLAQIVELLQCWPQKEYLRTCKRWRDFFDRHGQNFKRIGKLKIWPLKMVLIDEYKMSEELATEISGFLLPMLEFDPRNRVDAGSMCAHPWLKDISSGSNLSRRFGLHGEDIKGFYEEWE